MYSLRIWTLNLKLDLEHSNPIHITGSWSCTTIPSLHAKGSEVQVVMVLFRIWAHIVTLTLKIGTQTFYMTPKVMIMHQHNKFHLKRLSGSEDIVRTKSPRNWTLTETSPLQIAIQNCQTTLQLMMMHRYAKFGCKSFKNSGDTEEKQLILEDLTPQWPWPWR